MYFDSDGDCSPRLDNADKEDEITYIITRTGRKELLDTNKIVERLRKLIKKQPKISHVNPYDLMLRVCDGLKSGITTSEIDEYTANAAASLGIKKPYYLILAGRIAIDNHQKNTDRSFVDKMRKAYLREDDKHNIIPLLSKGFFSYVEEHQDFIEKTIDYSRDFLLDFFGFRTFQKMYGLRIKDKILERPQDMFMRTAIEIHRNTCGEDINLEYQKIKETYDALSNKLYTQASPTYFNAGTEYPQLASCFLLGSEDSRDGIMKTMDMSSLISKLGGGIGVHVHAWRGEGALIRSTNGTSSGVVPFLRILNDTMVAFNQGGRRLGSAAAYLMPHHPDYVSFLQLKLNGGVETKRARDLFYGCWLPDIFMTRMINDEMWSMFDPDETIDLSIYYDEQDTTNYTDKYLELEKAGRFKSQIKARELWELLYISNTDKGIPYICFSDTVNQMNMQKNIGAIKSSNLCVSGETLVLTREGYEPIKKLTETNGGNHEVWDGAEFSTSQFAKTGENKKLLKMTFSDGVELKCTPEHKFILENGQDVPAAELKVGDRLAICDFPVIRTGDSDDTSMAYISGFICTYDSYNNHAIHISADRTKQFDYLTCGDVQLNNQQSLQLCQRVGSTLVVPNEALPEFQVPVDHDIAYKLSWLAGVFDGSCDVRPDKIFYHATNLYTLSANKEFLMRVKLMCNTLGVNPYISADHEERHLLDDNAGDTNDKSNINLDNNTSDSNLHWSIKIYKHTTIYKLEFNLTDSNKLLEIGLKTNTFKLMSGQSNNLSLTVSNKEELDQPEDTYCFNEPLKHTGVFNGVYAKNCSEIMLYSDHNEYAVCNLCSISLPACVKDSYSEKDMMQPEEARRPLDHKFPINPTFDFQSLIDVVKLAVTNLNNVIDKSYYPCVETERSNFRHRPIGIGMQGLADTYLKMKYPFESDAARKLNKQIAETMYYAALSQSTRLCREEFQRLVKECKDKGKVTIKKHEFDNYNVTDLVYNNSKEIPKTVHAYPSMLWNGGSPISKGIFHWELYGLKKEELSCTYDWETLREHIKLFGVRNSLLLALMPTASTSQLLGNAESFEPYNSNIYKRKTLAGEYIVINNWLVNDMYQLGIWNESLEDYLIATGGSVQYIDGIPDDLKKLYKTVWEINQEEMIDQAIGRQPFIDQAMSLNWYIEKPSLSEFTNLACRAWHGKLKTGKYYLHSRPAVEAQKVSLDPAIHKQILEKIEKDKQLINTNFMEPKEVVCDLCSA